jgi:aspartyl-tRNA(Asn)/glutamyl-tRNA(Gln) amidotransferase subunit C
MIDRDKVMHVAALARLTLTEKEIETFTVQLGSILEYVEQLNAVDTESVGPVSPAVSRSGPLRADIERPSLSREELLGNGPRVKNNHFAVPKVIG